MLSFPTTVDLKNYTSTYSFINYFIDPLKLESFLKNSQTGAAHATFGADIVVLVKHLFASFVLCIIQLLLFCILRRFFKRFYQPRVFVDLRCVSEGFLNWMLTTWRQRSEDFSEMGLDACFFLRFIRFLLIYFVLAGSVNLAILIPLNVFFFDDAYRANGLDRFSISNVSKKKVNQMNFYFACALISILIFEVLIRFEFNFIARSRQEHLNSQRHRESISSRVVLLGNIPKKFRDIEVLRELFNQFAGGVDQIWLLKDYHDDARHYLYAKEAINELESHLLIVSYMSDIKFRKILEKNPGVLSLQERKFYPPIYLPLRFSFLSKQATYIRIPGFVRALAMKKPVTLFSWSMQTLESSHLALEYRRSELLDDCNKRMDKAFIMFKNQESAYLAHQTLLSPEVGKMDVCLVEVEPDDIIWHNLMRNSGIISVIIKQIISAIIIILTCLYVVPVCLITLISQIPLLTQLLPFMGFLRKIPTEASLIFSTLFPTLILSFLAEIQEFTFHVLLIAKGHWTGREVELDLQVWYFIFMFVQQFLVVSVLNSLVAVFLSLVEKPASIPLLLAQNIPLSSVFFFKYLSVKAFALCGSNFCRIRGLVRWVIVTSIFDKTPRQKTERLRGHLRVQWGSIYASFSVYGAIGIIYITIAPLVSLFMIVLLLFFMHYYKHAMIYMYDRHNSSETNGRLYSRALFQLYTGIYFFEFCMIGILLSLRNERGEHIMKIQALIMAIVFCLSVISNYVSSSRFDKLFRFAPQVKDEKFTLDEEKNIEGTWQTMNENEQRLLYLHPCYKYKKPIIWLPQDANGHSQKLLEMIGGFEHAIEGGSTRGAEITQHRLFNKLDVDYSICDGQISRL